MSNQIIILDMINKLQVDINNKMFTAENNILILKIKPQNYDLTDKVITANFSRTEVETIPLKVIDGIIQLPIYSNLIKYGTNYIQLNFRWDANKLEQSGKLMWVIDKSLETEGVAQEEVDIITYLVNIATQAKKDADDLVEVVQGKLDNGEFIGPIGPQGIQGEQGEQGIQGLKGDKGDQGIQGPKGDTGLQGPKGDKGDQGIQGPKGDTGLQGPKGDKGDQGIQGPKGDTGLQGPKGDKGDQGIQGPKGDTGLQGPKGDKGDKGEPGEVTLAELGAVQSELAAHKEEYTNQRQQDQLKIAKVEKDINDYQSTMATMNPNQEVKQKATGYGVVSLPKNSANGQVSVSVKGLTATNLIKNGDFSNGTTEWTSTNADIVATNSILSIIGTGDGSHPQAIQNTSILCVTGKKIFVKLKAKVTNTDCRHISIQARGTISGSTVSAAVKSFPIQNEMYSVGVTLTLTDQVGNLSVRLLHAYMDETVAAGKVMGVQEVLVVDLTAQGDMETDVNKLALKYPYINGTKSAISASRLKSVGKNLFDKSRININNNIKPTDTGKDTATTQGYIKNYDVIFGMSATGYFWNGISNNGTTNNVLKYSSNGTNNGYGVGVKIPKNSLTVGLTYTLSASSTALGEARIVFFDANGNFISGAITATIPINAEYVFLVFLRVNASAYTNDISNIQLEKSAVATPYEPYTSSTQYLPNVGELRSLPNGVRDEVRVSGGEAEHIKRVSGEVVLDGSKSWNMYSDSQVDVLGFYVTFIPPNRKETVDIGNYTIDQSILKTTVDIGYGGQLTANYEAFHLTSNIVKLSVAKTKVSNLATFKTWLQANPITLTYQLAQPIITPIEVSGNLVSYRSGTVYVEKVLPVAGIYNNGITVTHTDFPISSLDKISKVDFMTGVETQLDISKVVIAGDKKSFTHPDLANGNIVFFEYFYDIESTLGECEIEHYDSRHVLKDSVTGKFYKIVPTVANGVLTNGLVEV